MIAQVLPIARTTFLESIRQPVVLLLLFVAGVGQILTTWNTGYSLGYGSMESAEVTADDKLLLDIGLSTIFGVGAVLAGFIATAVLSREIEHKTVLTIISKPVSRVSVILGKFVGVSVAMLVCVVIMVITLLMALRHGVMTTAADMLDGPVLLFSGLALLTSIGLAGWCNFFYGWNFPQTTLLLLLPLSVLAYLGVLVFGEQWQIQPITKDWKPQILTACACLSLALLVLCAIAIAASTRLGQVMTIVACLTVFIAALLSNYFVGRHVFRADYLATVDSVEQVQFEQTFEQQGEVLVRLKDPLPRQIRPGDPIFYSPSPNGFPPMALGEYRPFAGDLQDINQLMGARAQGPAIIATQVRDQDITLRNIGAAPLPTVRPPQQGDYLFTTPVAINTPLLVLWGAIPNLQFFWVLDAVSQNRPLPAAYLGLTALYAFAQVTVFLAIAVILFQRRDVG